jgi:hypothetical protein
VRFDLSYEPVCTQRCRALFGGASQGPVVDDGKDGKSWIEGGGRRVNAGKFRAGWVRAGWVGAGSWAGVVFGITENERESKGSALWSFRARLGNR